MARLRLADFPSTRRDYASRADSARGSCAPVSGICLVGELSFRVWHGFGVVQCDGVYRFFVPNA